MKTRTLLSTLLILWTQSVWSATPTITVTFTPSYTFTPTPNASWTATDSFTPNPSLTPDCGGSSFTQFGRPSGGNVGTVSGTGFRASLFTLSQPATIWTISLYVASATAGSQVEVALYNGNTNAVGVLLGQTLPMTVVPGWNAFELQGPLNPGTYWLAYIYSTPGTIGIVTAPDVSGDLAYLTTGVNLSPFPVTIPGGLLTYGAATDDIFASYCVAPGLFPSPTPTLTNSLTPTATPSGSWTPIDTYTPTNTGTSTYTLSPTKTSSPTSSWTFTFTPTPTGTFLTPTWTATPTRTATPTITGTPTATYSVTPNPSLTPPCSPIASFGKTTLTGNSGAVTALTSIRLSRYTLSAPATVMNLSQYVYATGSTQLNLGLYQDGGGVVGGLLGQTGPATALAGWNTLPLTAPLQLNAGDYWLACYYNTTGSFTVVWDTTAGTNTLAYILSGLTFGNCPTTLGGLTYASNWHEALYASGCSAPGPFPTSTPTDTQSFTPTPTPSGSWTPAWTFTPTLTSTPSNTGTSTFTPTPSFTPTATRTPTPPLPPPPTGTFLTPTSTATPTRTATPTVTGTSTATFSVTPNPSLTPPCGIFSSFGKATTAGNSGAVTALTAIRLSRYTLSAPATVTTISQYVFATGTTQLNLGIYQDLGAVVGPLLGQTGPAAALAGWNTLALQTPLQLNAGDYWLACYYNTTGSFTADWAVTPAQTNSLAYLDSGLTFGTLPSGLVGLTYGSDWHETIYASYCPAPSPFPTSTSTPTPTATPTSSGTLTATPTRTASATPTATASGTPSPTSTGSLSPSTTPTLTFTASLTATPSATWTYTATMSATNTYSPTSSPSPTPSFSPTTSSTPSASPSPTATMTGTASGTATSTMTGTETSTPSSTPTLSPTPSPSPTPPATLTLSPSPTWTVSPTPSALLTATPSPTATSTSTPIPPSTWTDTPTPGSPTPTPTATATPNAFLDPGPEVVRLLPGPWRGDPPLAVWVNLLRPAERLSLKVFTTSYRKVAEWDFGPAPVGGSTWALDPAPAARLSNGIYYVVLRKPFGQIQTKWLILR